jgi:methionyl-tRNA synthetase
MTDKKFYITAAIPYVNAKPHIGHALEFVQTNTITRYRKLLGEDVVSLSGGDENALKNVQAAEEAGIPVQEFVDKNTELFRQLAINLNAEFDIWQKGSDKEKHFASAQKLWKLCEKDIFKKKYEGLYCVGCETFYSLDELNDKGECYEHPGKPLQKVSEENYFFALSKYQDKLIQLIKSDELKIIPETRKNEVLSFLSEPLLDISISRTNERAKNWGVPVPGDPKQRIYVWFDALNIYQSGIGFGWDEKKYKKWWPADVHVIGKGIIRFHAVYWPAFLLSANLALPKSIFVHGYFTIDGQKMSKTLGNVVDPAELIEKYGADALRYYLLAKFSPFSDGDFSESRLKEVYNADLANGLGNLVARVAKLCESNNYAPGSKPDQRLETYVEEALVNYKFNEALEKLWNEKVAPANKFVDENRPWELSGEKLKGVLDHLVKELLEISYNLRVFLPETAEKIEKLFLASKIKSQEPLFPRLK